MVADKLKTEYELNGNKILDKLNNNSELISKISLNELMEYVNQSIAFGNSTLLGKVFSFFNSHLETLILNCEEKPINLNKIIITKINLLLEFYQNFIIINKLGSDNFNNFKLRFENLLINRASNDIQLLVKDITLYKNDEFNEFIKFLLKTLSNIKVDIKDLQKNYHENYNYSLKMLQDN